YASAPSFLWQQLRPEPGYRHPAMREFHSGWEVDWYQRQRSLASWAVMWVGKAKLILNFFLPDLVMVMPWLALAWILRNRWMRFALLTCALLTLGLAQTTFASPHYAAPITCLVFVLSVQGMRHLRLWQWHGRPLGRFLIAAVPAVCLTTLAFSFFDMRDVDPHAAHLQRARMCAQFDVSGGSHLVLVPDGWNLGYDGWVY